MKEIMKILAKICRFIVLMGMLFFMFLNIYIFAIPFFEENSWKDIRQKTKQKLGKKGKMSGF